MSVNEYVAQYIVSSIYNDELTTSFINDCGLKQVHYPSGDIFSYALFEEMRSYEDLLLPEMKYLFNKYANQDGIFRDLVFHRATLWLQSYFPNYKIGGLKYLLFCSSLLMIFVFFKYDTELDDYNKELIACLLESEDHQHEYDIGLFRYNEPLVETLVREYETIREDEQFVYMRKIINIEESKVTDFVDGREVRIITDELQKQIDEYEPTIHSYEKIHRN